MVCTSAVGNDPSEFVKTVHISNKRLGWAIWMTIMKAIIATMAGMEMIICGNENFPGVVNQVEGGCN